jgi:galactose-1-phosphate uridylyltransferase
MKGERRITELPALIANLPEEDRVLSERLFDVSASTGRLVPPEEMKAWIESSFGSVEAVGEQEIVRVTNKATLEGTLFNSLRASRPLDTSVDANLEEEIAKTMDDPFCRPETGTPADTFGRVRGKHSITAANVAKYDAHHAVVVFDDHNPLDLTPEKVSNYISVATEWSRKVMGEDPEAKYPFLMWNCLWRAGGSIIHGHAQATMAKGSHYPKVERARRDAKAYEDEHASNYFDDLARVHETLGLGIPVKGARAFTSLTPIKEKEIVAIGESLDGRFGHAVGSLLERYVSDLGVSSFNVAFHIPPLGEVEEEWSHFPAVCRIVDRGSPQNRTSDIAAMELYAASVVASDPFEVAGTLRGDSIG